MFRPVIEFREDGKDYRKIGYLNLIEDATAMLRVLTEWLEELARKEAVRLSEKEEPFYPLKARAVVGRAGRLSEKEAP
jgi:hypothetical protein